MPDFAFVTRPRVEAALESGEAQQEGIEALAGWFQRFARQD
jgi:hypothetical protein